MIFLLQCFPIKNPSSVSTGPSVYIKLSTTTLFSSPTTSYPTVSSPSQGTISGGSITFSKNYAVPGLNSEFSLSFTLASTSLSSTSALIIVLPKYYNSNGPLNCKVNTQTTYCGYLSQGTLEIKAFETTISAGTQINLVIFGIIQNYLIAANLDTIFIGAASLASDISQFAYTGEKTDIISQTSVSQFNLMAFSMTSNLIRTTSTLDFTLKMPGSSISANSLLVVDFIDYSAYNYLLQWQNPSECKLTTADGLTTYSTSCQEIFGLRVKTKITSTLSANSLIKLSLKDSPNPDESFCNVGKWRISILSSDQTTVQYMAIYPGANFPTISFIKSANLKYSEFYTTANVQYSSENYIAVTAGTLSPQFNLRRTNSVAYNKNLDIAIQDKVNKFSLSTDGKIEIGSYGDTLRVGTASGTVAKNYQIGVTKTESTPITYANFPILPIALQLTKITITLSYYNYNVSPNGHSLPIIVDLSTIKYKYYIKGSGSIPFTQLILTGSITYDSRDLGFSFNSSHDQITLTSTTTKGYFAVTCSSGLTPIATDKATLSVALSGTDAAAFQINSTLIKLVLTTPPSSSTTLLLRYDKVSTSPLSAMVEFKPSDISRCFCAVTTSTGPDRNFEYTKTKVAENYQYNKSDYFQEQFYSINVETTATYTAATISNLRSYKMWCWPENLLGKVGTVAQGAFSAKDNTGKLMRIAFSFNGALNFTEKSAVSCWLCQYFSLPCENFDGIYCNKPAIVNLTSHISTQTNRQDTTETSLNFYFLPIDDIASDVSFNEISVKTQASSFKSEISAGLTNIRSLASVGIIAEVSFLTPVFNGDPVVTAGLTYLYVSNIKLKDRGMITFVIVQNQTNNTKPQAYQVHSWIDAQNQTSTAFGTVFYDYVTQNINFTNLTEDTSFNIYYIGTSDDPSIWASLTEVYTIATKTLAKPAAAAFGEILKLLGISWILLILIMIIN